jgi:hypothetical protein
VAFTRAEIRSELQKEAFLLRMLREDLVARLPRGDAEIIREWHRLEPQIEAVLARADEKEVSEELCWSLARAAIELRTLCGRLRGEALEGRGSEDLS